MWKTCGFSIFLKPYTTKKKTLDNYEKGKWIRGEGRVSGEVVNGKGDDGGKSSGGGDNSVCVAGAGRGEGGAKKRGGEINYNISISHA